MTGSYPASRYRVPVSAEEEVKGQAARRRTFAIISHPDAGKTTLTEKFLLYAGAVVEAGAVKARAGRRAARSDWMELEQQRGISVSSTVLQFDYRDHVINLLDTPGHRDFSEDTYRVLAAADAAVMVLDAAKGVEPQTRKLFEVCRSRNLPVLTFLNKLDRPGRDPLELLDEIQEQIGLDPAPITWPVGIPGDFRGVLDRRDGSMIRYERTARGTGEAGEQRLSAAEAAESLGELWAAAQESSALLDEVGASFDPKRFLAGESSPLFVGSALTNFGVRHLLDAVVDLAPGPSPARDSSGEQRPLDAPFSGFVFKVQANMNPAHRDHVAFVRVCSGHFERGMVLTHGPSGKPFATKYATSMFGSERNTVDDAWPGDVVGLVNASGLRVGDSLYESAPVAFPPIPTFAPELVASVHPRDLSRFKQFRKGLDQLEQEGVVQVLHRLGGDPNPVLAAVGQMQFEVFAHRMEHELGAAVELGVAQERTVRRTDAQTVPKLQEAGGVELLERRDGTVLAVFPSPYWLSRLENDHPDWTLEAIVNS
ncbi:peptide chain release factor 3 [Acidimicrobiaceae bacterium USS-CC1]|uniref:Peptide chain release factor 3 n=1 Tax=Acidiferrimicrobium australe TaxID=2664430 RepID=A0ABW9QUT9_9ACTN|nr:peptide chain release factor 3 [Acidiferrimicrobium australe]